MSLSKARQMREQRAKLVADATALIPAQGGLTTEIRTKFDQMMADADVLKKDIDRIEAAEAVEAELRTAPPSDQVDNTNKNEAEQRARKHEAAFRSYLTVRETSEMTAEERKVLAEHRDMGTGGGNALQGTGAGFFVPVSFINRVEAALKWFGGMLDVADIMETATGAPLPFPTDNDTAVTGEIVGEGVAVSAADVTIGNLVMNAYKFSSKEVKYSIELAQDSAFNVDNYVADKAGTRLGRILNTKFTIGTGVNEPKGIVVASAAGPTATGSAANDGSAATGANSIGSDDLVALIHSVDPAYRSMGAKFMFHDATLKALRQLKDKYGRPLWQPGVGSNAPDTIFGYAYQINNDMAQIATTNKTVLFGLLSKYTIRKVKGLSVVVLRERYAENGQLAAIGFARYDGNLLDAGTHPVKYLVQA